MKLFFKPTNRICVDRFNFSKLINYICVELTKIETKSLEMRRVDHFFKDI
jgi:hypothetical protein